jgi:hypothetical protein
VHSSCAGVPYRPLVERAGDFAPADSHRAMKACERGRRASEKIPAKVGIFFSIGETVPGGRAVILWPSSGECSGAGTGHEDRPSPSEAGGRGDRRRRDRDGTRCSIENSSEKLAVTRMTGEDGTGTGIRLSSGKPCLPPEPVAGRDKLFHRAYAGELDSLPGTQRSRTGARDERDGRRNEIGRWVGGSGHFVSIGRGPTN